MTMSVFAHRDFGARRASPRPPPTLSPLTARPGPRRRLDRWPTPSSRSRRLSARPPRPAPAASQARAALRRGAGRGRNVSVSVSPAGSPGELEPRPFSTAFARTNDNTGTSLACFRAHVSFVETSLVSNSSARNASPNAAPAPPRKISPSFSSSPSHRQHPGLVYSTKRERARDASLTSPITSPPAPGGIEPATARSRRVGALSVRGPANPDFADGIPAADVVARVGIARARSAALTVAHRGSASRQATRATGARDVANARVEDMCARRVEMALDRSASSFSTRPFGCKRMAGLIRRDFATKYGCTGRCRFEIVRRHSRACAVGTTRRPRGRSSTPWARARSRACVCRRTTA